MHRDNEEREPAFKVVDRRRFTEEGDLRPPIDESRAHSEAKEVPKTSPNINAEKDFLASPPAVTFSIFIETLAHQAMMALGILPWPDSGLNKIDLMVAKETIDIVQMLKEKTLGNTTKDEQVLLDNLLYQLQVAFVEISQKPSSGSALTS